MLGTLEGPATGFRKINLNEELKSKNGLLMAVSTLKQNELVATPVPWTASTSPVSAAAATVDHLAMAGLATNAIQII